jgi:hypothetical protein
MAGRWAVGFLPVAVGGHLAATVAGEQGGENRGDGDEELD